MSTDLLVDTYNLLSNEMQKLAFDYITFLAIRENKTIQNEDKSKINPELKEILDKRILEYQANPNNVTTWNEVKKKFNEKYNYAI